MKPTAMKTAKGAVMYAADDGWHADDEEEACFGLVSRLPGYACDLTAAWVAPGCPLLP